MAADDITTTQDMEKADGQALESKDSLTLDEHAQMAREAEHSLTFRRAISKYKMACFWSGVVSLTIIMDGYDTALLGSLQAYPSFQRQFGHQVGNTNNYQVAAPWQIALGISTPLGNIFGIYLNALVTDRFGHKRSLEATLIILMGFIFIPFFAKSIEVIFVGELLCGVCWGVFTTMAPAYASEVCPVILRSYLETLVVLCWSIGQFVAYGVLSGLSGRKSDPWGWRIPIAVKWAWPVIIFPLVLFAPESPWWLVRHGHIKRAEETVMRLSKVDELEAKQSVALMIRTNNREKAMVEGTSTIDCFKGTNLRRTEISCVIWVIQQLSGFVISGYATYFYEQAGLPAGEAFHMSIGQAGIHFICTLIAFPLSGRVGRRPLILWGEAGMAISMLVIGFVALAPYTSGQGYGESAVYLVWFCFYELTIGPGAYIVVGETSTTRLRNKTVGLARNAYNVTTIVNYVIGPYILNPTEGNWKGKCGFLTGGIIILCTIWTYFRLPETRGRTYEELDILFSMKLPARDFKKQPIGIAVQPNATVSKEDE